MISVQRSLGRLIVVSVVGTPTFEDVLRFQQDLGSVLRRAGEGPFVVTDLRQLAGMSPEIGRMLSMMLQPKPLVRREAFLVGDEGSLSDLFVQDLLEGGPSSRRAVRDETDLRAFLDGLTTPPELMALSEIAQPRLAA